MRTFIIQDELTGSFRVSKSERTFNNLCASGAKAKEMNEVGITYLRWPLDTVSVSWCNESVSDNFVVENKEGNV